MIRDQILAEIDAALERLRKPLSMEEASHVYEKVGRAVTGLRARSIAYRRSERKKGVRIREELRARTGREA